LTILDIFSILFPMNTLETGPLGIKTPYVQTYSPNLLFPISRQQGRQHLAKDFALQGCDIWTGYELSWLNEKGKPTQAMARFTFPCSTPYLVESKSFKLYLNSFNQSRFSSPEEVRQTMQQDLSQNAGGDVTVEFFEAFPITKIPGECLDHLDIDTNVYEPCQKFLQVGDNPVHETLISHLMKSNCLATGQPDWGTIIIDYQGPQIDREGLLKYIVSYRNHSGFAEHCAEQIFTDLMIRCQPEKLSLNILYTRRGGLDINPFRSTWKNVPNIHRLCRQ